LETGAFDLLLDQDKMLTSIAFARTNAFLCGSNAGTVTVVDPRAPPSSAKTVEIHDRKVCALQLHPNKDLFVTASLDKSVSVFDLRKVGAKKPLAQFEHNQVCSIGNFASYYYFLTQNVGYFRV
jgi:WD40 repeat protein